MAEEVLVSFVALQTISKALAVETLIELAFLTEKGLCEEVIVSFVALETTSKALAVETLIELAFLTEGG